MRVIIEHRDGRSFSVTVADFRRLYEDEGFKIVRNEDGTPYERSSKPAPADAGSGGAKE